LTGDSSAHAFPSSTGEPADSIRRQVHLVPGLGTGRLHLVHPFNGRFHPIDHDALESLVAAMARRINIASVDCVLGFPEGGSIPAYAFGRAVGRPVLLASRMPLDLPDSITFEQPQAGLGKTHHLYGLRRDDRVMIFEDEMTNGRTAVNAAQALRKAGLRIDLIATLFVIDHPILWKRMEAAGLTLHAGVRLPVTSAPRPLDTDVE
jgi:adenine/guanine phosphoribosyltransferase-like PRPP-binding protein